MHPRVPPVLFVGTTPTTEKTSYEDLSLPFGFNIFVLAVTVRFMATSDVNAAVESFKTSSMILSSKEGRKVTLWFNSCTWTHFDGEAVNNCSEHTFTVPRNSFEVLGCPCMLCNRTKLIQKRAAHALIAC
ncbi:hypothetical protein Pelo_6029 [Pelomyxa schiedti]|nr:hypothetical protein Pelo_6029 [Pelomyxa schiedti]